MISRSPSLHPARSGAFSLVEILVALTLLAFLFVLVAKLSDGTLKVTSSSRKQTGADSEVRQAFDRMRADFSLAVLRSDLPPRLEKQPGNDAIGFHVQADGYTGDRAISRIGYRIHNGDLLRAAEGTFWEANSGEQVAFGSAWPSATPGDAVSAPVGSTIFRMEIVFLMEDGSLRRSASAFLQPGSASASSQNVRAMIVGLAAVDAVTWGRFGEDLASVAALLPDAVDGSDLLGLWGPVLNDPAFYSGESGPPAEARRGIRIYQRCFYLPATR